MRGDLEYFVFVGRCGIVKCKRVGSGRFGAFREKRDEGRRLLGKRAFPGSDEGATIVVSSGEEEAEEQESEVEDRKRGRLPLLTLSTPSNSASNARRSAPPRSLTEIWPAEILKEILIFTISRRARASSA